MLSLSVSEVGGGGGWGWRCPMKLYTLLRVVKNKFNKVKVLMAGVIKDDGSEFVNQVANYVIDDIMTEQDFIDLSYWC